MRTASLVLIGIACLQAPSLRAQIKAQLPNAHPACVFYDADLCKNDDFTLALFTPYKMVAYEVWQTVKNHQPPPTPSYSEAQRTRVTLGVTRASGNSPSTSRHSRPRATSRLSSPDASARTPASSSNRC